MRRVAESLLACALVALGAAPVRAATEHHAQQWTLLTLTGRLAHPGLEAGERSTLLAFLELQPRLSLARAVDHRVLLRGAVGWDAARLLPGLSLWLGAAWIPAWSEAGEQRGLAVNEGRWFQQALWSRAPGAVAVQARLRFEERVLESAPRALSTRARAMLRAGWALPGTQGRAGPLAWDELFVTASAGATGPARGFDRNRAFAGAFFRPEPWLSLEAGYLNEVVDSGALLRVHHVAAFTAAVNLL